MVNQNSTGWGESNPTEQHNKASWSNKQPNRTGSDGWRNGFLIKKTVHISLDLHFSEIQ